jgi:hypothetical protein
MPRSAASPAVLLPAGLFPISEGTLVGVDAEGRLVPVDRAARFVGVAGESHPGVPNGEAEDRVEVAAGTFTFGFVGWTPTFADKGRTVWAFSETEVAGAPLRTTFEVGRVVAPATTTDGRPGVSVEIDRVAAR